MNYSGFLRPVWWWLRDESFARDPFRADFPAPIFAGASASRRCAPFVPVCRGSRRSQSWTLLDSHDTPRSAP